MRVRGGKVLLDSTGIHPERYKAVREMIQEAGLTVAQAVGGNLEPIRKLKEKWVQLIGEYTFDDIVNELAKPGRDPRDPYKVFKFREDIHEIKDLKAELTCPGIVTNVTNFGAFVDIGVHQDGLVHISQLTHDFVEDPRLVVSPGDQVTVKVLAVDQDKKQISLTMKLEERPVAVRPPPRPRAEGERTARRDNRHDSRRDNRRPDGDNRQRSDGKPRDNRPRGDGKPQDQGQVTSGGRPAEKRSRDGRRPDNRSRRPDNRSQQPARPKQVFNNPFAALGDLNKKN